MPWNRRFFPLVVIAALIALGAWLAREREQVSPEAEATASTEADAYLVGARVLSADASGRWQHRIVSERMAHYGDHWKIDQPLFTLYAREGADWEGRSERAEIADASDTARLLGEVVIDRAASPANPETHILTSDVRLRPEARYAETDAAVVVTQPRRELRGIGARLELDRDRLELLSNVRGFYAPEH